MKLRLLPRCPRQKTPSAKCLRPTKFWPTSLPKPSYLRKSMRHNRWPRRRRSAKSVDGGVLCSEGLLVFVPAACVNAGAIRRAVGRVRGAIVPRFFSSLCDLSWHRSLVQASSLSHHHHHPPHHLKLFMFLLLSSSCDLSWVFLAHTLSCHLFVTLQAATCAHLPISS